MNNLQKINSRFIWCVKTERPVGREVEHIEWIEKENKFFEQTTTIMPKQRKNSPYESVLAVTFLLLLLYYFFFTTPWFLIFTICFVLLALLSSTLAGYISQLWELLTISIGWLMSRVLMSAVFVVILTPIAFLYRLSKRKKDAETDSHFVDRNHLYTPKDIENPW